MDTVQILFSATVLPPMNHCVYVIGQPATPVKHENETSYDTHTPLFSTKHGMVEPRWLPYGWVVWTCLFVL